MICRNMHVRLHACTHVQCFWMKCLINTCCPFMLVAPNSRSPLTHLPHQLRYPRRHWVLCWLELRWTCWICIFGRREKNCCLLFWISISEHQRNPHFITALFLFGLVSFLWWSVENSIALMPCLIGKWCISWWRAMFRHCRARKFPPTPHPNILILWISSPI